MTDPETHAAQEAFVQRLGVKLIDVWVYNHAGWWITRQVDDHDTFLETLEMSMRNYRARFALWDDGEMWCLLDRETGDTKRYPNRAAAEMVAIHGRR